MERQTREAVTKLEIKAIQRLPKRYVRDGTQVCVCRGAKGDWPVAIHQDLPPIQFIGTPRKWHRLKLTPFTESIVAIRGH